MNKAGIIITEVDKNSIGYKIGLAAGDKILAINGEDVTDIIVYKYLSCDKLLNMIVEKNNGKEVQLNIQKEMYEDMGLGFDCMDMENAKRCFNKCIFCFIDQLPPGMRESLYIKDDDSIFSFLQGNFITMTNMSDDDLKRIIKYRISPINVSVHTTNPELRIKMMNNKNAGKIKEQIKTLTDGGISLNCQIVLCPGINDGIELKNTIYDLYKFYPMIQNVAVVPVGLSGYREGLFSIDGYNRELSKKLIDEIKPVQNEFIQRTGEPFARLADEFYILAGYELPKTEHYGDFEQVEDGIGMSRYFEDSINTSFDNTHFNGRGFELNLVTGIMCSEFLKQQVEGINKRYNVNINIWPVVNKYLGGKINVAGLVCGKDVISQLEGKIKGSILLMPSNMFKAYEDVMLDDVTVSNIENVLHVKIIKCKYTGEDLIEKIDEVVKCQNR